MSTDDSSLNNEKIISGRMVTNVLTSEVALTESNQENSCSGEDINSKKEKKKIRNLADFISYIYSRKGQKVSLKPKVAKAICSNSRIPNEIREDLLSMAEGDFFLVVPRQLLFLRNHEEFAGYVIVKDFLLEFVTAVLRRHPLFKADVVRDIFLGNPSPEGIINALVRVASPDTSKVLRDTDGELLKPKMIEALRKNATYCFSLWLYETQEHVSFEQLCRWLNTSLWLPEAAKIKDDYAKLRELTEIQALSGVGLVCNTFLEEAEAKYLFAERAQREKALALEEIKRKELLSIQLRADLSAKDEEVFALQRKIEELNKQHQDALAHSLDDNESLRANMLRHLKADAELLSDGLHALRRKEPLIHVMDDHAERVLESLRVEITRLSEGV